MQTATEGPGERKTQLLKTGQLQEPIGITGPSPGVLDLSAILMGAMRELAGPGVQREMQALSGVSERSLRNWGALRVSTRRRVISSLASRLRTQCADPALVKIYDDWAGTESVTLPPLLFDLMALQLSAGDCHELRALARRLDDVQRMIGYGVPCDAAALAGAAEKGVANLIGEPEVPVRAGLARSSSDFGTQAKQLAFDASYAFLAMLDLDFTRRIAPGFCAYPAFLCVVPGPGPMGRIETAAKRVFEFMAARSELRADRRRLLSVEKIVAAHGGSPQLRNELIGLRAGRGAMSTARFRRLERLLYPNAAKQQTAFGPLWFAACVWDRLLGPVFPQHPRDEWEGISRAPFADYLVWWNYFNQKERASGVRRGSKPWPAELCV